MSPGAATNPSMAARRINVEAIGLRAGAIPALVLCSIIERSDGCCSGRLLPYLGENPPLLALAELQGLESESDINHNMKRGRHLARGHRRPPSLTCEPGGLAEINGGKSAPPEKDAENIAGTSFKGLQRQLDRTVKDRPAHWCRRKSSWLAGREGL